MTDENDKPLDVLITFDSTGRAQVKVKGGNYGFDYAGLLTSDRKQRIKYLDGYLRGRTLAKQHSDQLRSKVQAATLSDDEFLSIIEVLSTTPESFVRTVRAKVATRDLTNSDILPDDLKYWDNLIAPWSQSGSLDEFLADECKSERARLIRDNRARAFDTISLSFCAPALVPIDAFKDLSPDELLQMLERAAWLPDHFGVTGAFEICADGLARDSRLESVGLKLLDQLFSDMDQLKSRCAFYGGVFTLALARLAQHQTLSQKPPFWRRVTASAHASLVIRACGSDNADKFFKWAIEHSGKPFLFSVLLEGDREPRWRPEWLTTRHLVADAFGRVDAAVTKIPEEGRPKAWLERIDKAREWIVAQGVELFCILPAIGESARRKLVTEDDTFGFKKLFQKLTDEPNVKTS